MLDSVTPNQEKKLTTAAEALGEDPRWLTTLFNLNLLNIKESLKEYTYVEDMQEFKLLTGTSTDETTGLSLTDILTLNEYTNYTATLFPTASVSSTTALSKQEIFYLANHPDSNESLTAALNLLLSDLGYQVSPDNPNRFIQAENFAEQIDKWAFEKSSLDEVISKALLSLIHQGKREAAEFLLGELEEIVEQYREKGTLRLLTTWRNNVYAENSSILKD